MKLGIVHERIQAGRPQQNGRHERMHRTLKEDTTKPPAASLRAQQSRFDSLPISDAYQKLYVFATTGDCDLQTSKDLGGHQ